MQSKALAAGVCRYFLSPYAIENKGGAVNLYCLLSCSDKAGLVFIRIPQRGSDFGLAPKERVVCALWAATASQNRRFRSGIHLKFNSLPA
jgi:hypothetical protein